MGTILSVVEEKYPKLFFILPLILIFGTIPYLRVVDHVVGHLGGQLGGHLSGQLGHLSGHPVPALLGRGCPPSLLALGKHFKDSNQHST